MLELRLATEAELTLAFERDLAAAFPPAELKPLREMRGELRGGEYCPWCLFDGGELIGEAFVWTHVPGFSLLDYLCVTASRRNEGLGRTLLKKLCEAERGGVIFGEAEIPGFAPDAAMAERRLAFYGRSDARRAGYDACVFGVPYHTIYWAEGAVDEDALRAAHAETYRSRFKRFTYKRCVVIPWEPSMGIPKKFPWLG